MGIVETTLPGVGFDALIGSHRDGDLAVVTIGAMVFVQWSVDDRPGRPGAPCDRSLHLDRSSRAS